MEIYEHRIVNGLLKELPTIATPEAARATLHRDAVIAPGERGLDRNDLWPCVWALAIVLSKQFTGKIYLQAKASQTPEAPTDLPDNVRFSPDAPRDAIQIRIGVGNGRDPNTILGDARGNAVGVSRTLPSELGRAHPISCFALAGYLGFAALAECAGIPKYREAYLQDELRLPFEPNANTQLPKSGVAFLGLGHVGQAHLSLMYFLAEQAAQTPTVFLLDRDRFQLANEATQILLCSRRDWLDQEKAPYLARIVTRWGWDNSHSQRRLEWPFVREPDQPEIAFLGLDNFDARRIALEGGFDWLLESGIGTSLAHPRVTWHSLPPNRILGRQLFFERTQHEDISNKEYFHELRRTPGQCGWTTFENIKASAPSLGLIAAAFAWAEAINVFRGARLAISGTALVWPPLLPFCRTTLEVQNRAA